MGTLTFFLRMMLKSLLCMLIFFFAVHGIHMQDPSNDLTGITYFDKSKLKSSQEDDVVMPKNPEIKKVETKKKNSIPTEQEIAHEIAQEKAQSNQKSGN